VNIEVFFTGLLKICVKNYLSRYSKKICLSNGVSRYEPKVGKPRRGAANYFLAGSENNFSKFLNSLDFFGSFCLPVPQAGVKTKRTYEN
jgi:hypothetical protein